VQAETPRVITARIELLNQDPFIPPTDESETHVVRSKEDKPARPYTAGEKISIPKFKPKTVRLMDPVLAALAPDAPLTFKASKENALVDVATLLTAVTNMRRVDTTVDAP
jgi:hypothetical protein